MKSTTTWFIEEIDENEKELVCNAKICLEIRALDYAPKRENQSGGSSLSAVRDSLFLFGGCDRHGEISGLLQSFNLCAYI